MLQARTLLWVFLLIATVGSASAYLHVTSGTSGEHCEDGGGRRCLYPKGRCVNGKCVCPQSLVGAGDFDCREPTTFSGHTHSDPVLTSMNGETTDMPITCRYLFTHFTTTYSRYADSTCTLQVHIFQSKLKGKVFVEGMDIALKVESPNLPEHYGDFSIRTYGNATSNVYTFDEHGQLTYSPDGPWRNEDGHLRADLPGGYLALTHDPYNNMAKFRVADCGFNVTFRPADPALGMHQTLIPGVSVDVDANSNPQFLENHRCLNIPPQQHHHLDEMAADIKVTRQQAQMYKAFMSNVKQNQPDAAGNCNEIPKTLTACPKKQLNRAMGKCHFIITHALVMNCLDDSTNGNTILAHYNKCIEAMCDKSHKKCVAVQDGLQHCSHVHLFDSTFMDAETCTF